MSELIKWKSIDTVMPDDDQEVLICIDDSPRTISLGYHDGDDGWRSMCGMPVLVTHWAKMPEGPKR